MTSSRLAVRLALVAGVFAVLSGCTLNRKFVTAKRWENADTLYAAYTDETSMMGFVTGFHSNVRKCSRTPQNALVCREQEALNKVLNSTKDTRELMQASDAQ